MSGDRFRPATTVNTRGPSGLFKHFSVDRCYSLIVRRLFWIHKPPENERALPRRNRSRSLRQAGAGTRPEAGATPFRIKAPEAACARERPRGCFTVKGCVRGVSGPAGSFTAEPTRTSSEPQSWSQLDHLDHLRAAAHICGPEQLLVPRPAPPGAAVHGTPWPGRLPPGPR